MIWNWKILPNMASGHNEQHKNCEYCEAIDLHEKSELYHFKMFKIFHDLHQHMDL